MPLPRLAVALLASSLAAQTMHIVGPGGFAQIRAALAVAANGDEILVHPGNYAHFDVMTGVTLRAITPGAVTVAYDRAFAPPGCASVPGCPATQGATRFLLPPGQTAHVVGVRFLANAATLPGGPVVWSRVEVSGGRTTFDQCEFQSAAPQALQIQHAVVHLQDCVAMGTNVFPPASHAVAASNARVTVVGGTLTGAPSAFANNPGGDGVRLDSSTFHGSGLQARGGASHVAPAGAAIRANGGVTWISDAVVQAGNNACSFVVTGTLHAARIAGCPTAAGTVLGVLRPAPLQIGATFTLEFRTDPNASVTVFASLQLATNGTGLVAPEPYLDPAGLLPAGVAVAGSNGTATAAYLVPNNTSLVGVPFWFQGLTSLSLPLHASPVAGGIVR